MRHAIAAAVYAAALLFGSAANAGVYGDDLGKCLVDSSSQKDRVILVQWMFSALALNPAVTPLSAITAEERISYDKAAAVMVQRLLLENCEKEFLAALKNEGDAAVAGSFQLFGEVAARTLMNDPAVDKGLSRFADYFDKERFEAVGKGAP
jgi:hypothetical protein